MTTEARQRKLPEFVLKNDFAFLEVNRALFGIVNFVGCVEFLFGELALSRFCVNVLYNVRWFENGNL